MERDGLLYSEQSMGQTGEQIPASAAAPIIDMHVHTAGIGACGSGCFVSPGLRSNWRYRIYLRAFGVSEVELQEVGDALIIEKISRRLEESEQVSKAVVLALDGAATGGALDLSATELYIPNNFISRETAKYDNLLFGASVNPYRADALDRLDEVAESGAVLLKWLPPIQNIDPADKRLTSFYCKLNALELPLLTHAGHERSFTGADQGLADPFRLRLPLDHGVVVIAAHAATTGKSDGEDNMERLLRLFPAYPNLYADISTLTQVNKLGFLSKLLRSQEARGRLLYGTDMPLPATGLVNPWFFFFQLGWKKTMEVSKIKNPWDRDVALKRALGVSDDAFAKASFVLFNRTLNKA